MVSPFPKQFVSVDDSTFAPKFAIKIGKQLVEESVAQFVRQIEYESADGMADVARITCTNPDDKISDAKIFQPGNEVSLFFGYKEPLKHVGRTVIIRQVPFYPQNGLPVVTITGYTKDYAFADNSPDKSKKRRFKDATYSEAVERIASDYKMELDIDGTEHEPKALVQLAGVTDYEFIQGLANITGYVFWVDGDENGIWTLHFRNPLMLKEQDKEYTFKYRDGNLSSLLSFRPELLIKGAKTKIEVVIKDHDTGRVIKVEVEEENDSAPDMDATGDPTGEVNGEYTSGSDIKLFFNDYSFEIIANRRIRTEAEAIMWAQQWFRRQRENFILASGESIGLETLMARQEHNISGISKAYAGRYYFSKVKHIINNNGYTCNFNCRRIVP
jgi:phage protein D